jgi:hypothetical protein
MKKLQDVPSSEGYAIKISTFAEFTTRNQKLVEGSRYPSNRQKI